MSIPFKIVYLLKDGESGENLIQTDAIMELNAIDGAKIVDNTIPSAKLNAIDGHKIVDKSIPLNKLIADFDLVYQITNSPPSVLKLGMPVYWNGTDYMPANANSHNKIPTAIIKELNEYDYTVQFSGIFILPNEKWALVTDQLDGLSVSNNRYYLSDTNDGYITNSSPALSVPIYNCLKNDGINSIVEIKFGILHSLPTNNSHSEEREIFIGNGTKNTFTLAKTPYSRNSTKVTVNGKVIQNLGFSVVNKDIVFVDAPLDEEEIDITYLSQKSFNYANTPPTTTYDKGRFKIQQVVNKSYEVESTFYDAFWGSWIAELLSSPEVYMETPSGLVAVIIEDSQIKIEETNELVNVTLTIIEANEISTQQN